MKSSLIWLKFLAIDEQFLDVTASLPIFGDPVTIAKSIQQKVLSQTGVWVRVGISSNKILAKIATDIWAKKNESGIFTLPKTEVETFFGRNRLIRCSVSVHA